MFNPGFLIILLGFLIFLYIILVKRKENRIHAAARNNSNNPKLNDAKRAAIKDALERAGNGDEFNLIEVTILRMHIQEPTLEHIADFGKACYSSDISFLSTSRNFNLDESLIFEKENQSPGLVLCTSQERTDEVIGKYPEYKHLITLPFKELVKMIPPTMGLVINPFSEVMTFTMSPDKVQGLASSFVKSDTAKKPSPKENQSLNKIEKLIVEHNEGENKSRYILELLSTKPIHLPCVNDEGTQPLLVKGPDNEPSVVICTSKERIDELGEIRASIKTVRVVNLAEYLLEITDTVAITINPGWIYPFTMPVETVQQIKDATHIEAVTLDSIIEEYHSGKKDMVKGHVIKAMMQFMMAIVVKGDDLSNLEDEMARIEREGKTYNCLFSSEKYTALYKEKYPEYINDAAAQGNALLSQIPPADGVILNPDSDREMIFSNNMLHIVSTMPLDL